MAIEIKVPDIGADEVEITEILVKVGDKVEAEQSLITCRLDTSQIELDKRPEGML
ncbi:biotin/lipoyl-containing protein, partial [Escherichia coli]|uniref:biotin/lipoyl-containing protein n=1 Tax=Escherichia coli TaxID=562 RepID=UPI0034D9727C